MPAKTLATKKKIFITTKRRELLEPITATQQHMDLMVHQMIYVYSTELIRI